MKNYFLREAEARVISALPEGGSASTAEIALGAGIGPASVLSVLTLLEARDFVRLSARPNNRAGVEATLTDDGRVAKSLLEPSGSARHRNRSIILVDGPRDSSSSPETTSPEDVDAQLDLLVGPMSGDAETES